MLGLYLDPYVFCIGVMFVCSFLHMCFALMRDLLTVDECPVHNPHRILAYMSRARADVLTLDLLYTNDNMEVSDYQ